MILLYEFICVLRKTPISQWVKTSSCIHSCTRCIGYIILFTFLYFILKIKAFFIFWYRKWTFKLKQKRMLPILMLIIIILIIIISSLQVEVLFIASHWFPYQSIHFDNPFLSTHTIVNHNFYQMKLLYSKLIFLILL